MSFRSRRGKMLHPGRVSFLRYHPCWSRRRRQPKTNIWRGTSDSSAVFCVQSSAGRGTFPTKKRSVKPLAGVNGRECWQQVGHGRQAGNLGHLSFLGLEIDLKRNLHPVLVLILEPSLSSSSVTLQCSKCRNHFPLSFCLCLGDLRSVVCSLRLSQDARDVCAADCLDFSPVYHLGA